MINDNNQGRSNPFRLVVAVVAILSSVLFLFQIAVVLSGICICFLLTLKNKNIATIATGNTVLPYPLENQPETGKPLDGDRRKVISTYRPHRH
jgi:hypothetical protein